jgi:hypothetical protein
MLAMKYKEISNTVPLMLEKTPIPDAFVRRQRAVNWALLTLNILFPVLEPFFTIPQAIEVRNQGAPLWLDVGACLIPDIVGLLQVISGVQLVTSIFKIKKFLSGKSEEVMIDTRTMLMYAVSFSLYLVAEASELISFNISVDRSIYESVPLYYSITLIFWASCSFASQVLLCFIFWDLANEEDKTVESVSFEEVAIESFDDDAKLQAKIWNRF